MSDHYSPTSPVSPSSELASPLSFSSLRSSKSLNRRRADSGVTFQAASIPKEHKQSSKDRLLKAAQKFHEADSTIWRLCGYHTTGILQDNTGVSVTRHA
ncbi:hypothetical protein GUITHDRAFT_116207 [Guillardia theta CCMP2712]|uniref:Uncharacterized protein n=1 Tax=Guillardia theta (strain CCMP2712) TaxID=905079 RepID=L1IN95_GUITC|nr:hypothetical protein GUITHDRAFT_116207 [Guillardia theta CCMP2712]EKX37567.1 hypothetical protein GUITHDRAFT_116207 [Guillardia theta CCMP2712]|eukprot:XP_005824547.1 hypothetical protein GUITHDRAFT_116207 [Guillardia theta CCMP2712]